MNAFASDEPVAIGRALRTNNVIKGSLKQMQKKYCSEISFFLNGIKLRMNLPPKFSIKLRNQ